MAQHVGTVTWFDSNTGFLFLASPGMKEVFCYESSIQDGGYETLVEGEAVEFDVERGPEGSQAVNVRRLK